MELTDFHNNYDSMGYENEVTKKIVWKILNNMNDQNDLTLERIQQTRNKIVKYFSEAELLFKYYDVGRLGEVDINLFPKMARTLKQIYDWNDVKKFEKEMKIKKINKMTLPIFLTLLKRKLFQVIDFEETFQKHFNILDMEKKKKINIEKLKNFVGSIGDKISSENFDFFIKYNMENNDKIVKDNIIFNQNNNPTDIPFDVYKEVLTFYKSF
ncbi:EF hand domain-containing protein, putative [Plasmodium yoelii]|uniref:EF hand domain-containing protein n=2 Tax=Plasmodium yoelii TaxID=5861 RepID=A0AAE9WLI7_PLAYO|nr:EF hand domain-containing protein, putative [Plasmodium yoelii]WBY54740.1 EF hand domain-containing protein [Plasmodium yoelii yoelii]CDU16099.1 conserved Plasmodium protein, unknown function [Plasmodium yoelii]VTZ71724.1 EF hand domain-containing protein, putative [Plasmodium yoelii]|eukprot:XP_022811361.1 EF hand domain-containing protein, putative [Plasmodium yoelii]